jgi:hypothetical protein
MKNQVVNTHFTRSDIERETDRALLVRISNGVTNFHARFVWLPKSQVTWLEETVGYGETLHIPAWLARKAFN